MHRFEYLIAVLPLLVVWCVAFASDKDARRSMLSSSFLVGGLSLISAYLWWTRDWWHPATFLGTRIGIEDFLIGFSMGGSAAGLYHRLVPRTLFSQDKPLLGLLPLLLCFLLPMSVLFYFVRLDSFHSFLIAVLIASFVGYLQVPKLILPGIECAVFLTLISLLFYATILATDSRWVVATYVPAIVTDGGFLGVPYSEYLFWALAGFYFGPLYMSLRAGRYC